LTEARALQLLQQAAETAVLLHELQRNLQEGVTATAALAAAELIQYAVQRAATRLTAGAEITQYVAYQTIQQSHVLLLALKMAAA
jgi:hypothetical protein